MTRLQISAILIALLTTFSWENKINELQNEVDSQNIIDSQNTINSRSVDQLNQFVIAAAIIRNIEDSDKHKRLLKLNYYSESRYEFIDIFDATFVDDGTFGDEISGDGIYTSVLDYDNQYGSCENCTEYTIANLIGVSENLRLSESEINSIIAENPVTRLNSGNSDIDDEIQASFGIKFGCDVGTTTSGTNFFGVSCDGLWPLGACLTASNCFFEIEMSTGGN